MLEPQITIRGMPHSPVMDKLFQELAQKLEESHPRITSCRVVVDEYGKHRHKRRQFQVTVDVNVPGHEVVASLNHHEDAYLAVGEAFDDLARQLADVIRIQRAEAKPRRDQRDRP